MVRDKTRTLASPPLPRLVGPSQGCKLHGAPIRTLAHASGPFVWALGRFQPTANAPVAVRFAATFRIGIRGPEAYRWCESFESNPMTRARGLVVLDGARVTRELAEHFRLRERVRQGATARRHGTDCCS